MMSQLIEYITQYVPLTDQEIETISGQLQVQAFKKGTVLLEAGQVSRASYFNFKGCVRLYYSVEGEEKTTFFFTENQFITSMLSLTKQVPSTHYLQCVEDCDLVVIPYDQEAALLKQIPALESFSRIILEQELGNYQTMMATHIISSPEQRYLHLLDTNPALINRIPQHQLATFLGVLPESLSRIRNRVANRRS